MRAHSLSTRLDDRTLWFDGDSSFDPSNLHKSVRLYDVKYVDYIDDEVRNYNRNVTTEQELVVKTECGELNHTWNIPKEFSELDVIQYVMDKHMSITATLPDDEVYDRDVRLANELALYNKHGLLDVLRTIIYVINTLTTEGVVWGVGRGSSVSSYVLYVIGVHDVDIFLYDLYIHDFISDN